MIQTFDLQHSLLFLRVSQVCLISEIHSTSQIHFGQLNSTQKQHLGISKFDLAIVAFFYTQVTWDSREGRVMEKVLCLQNTAIKTSPAVQGSLPSRAGHRDFPANVR